MSDDQIRQHRDAIDAIDVQILKLINERASHAHEIGVLKGGGLVYRPEREAQVLRRIKELNQGPLPAESMARLFREIMSACLSLEKPLTISFLGPLGTFSESAVVKHFGHAANLQPCVSIDEVFRQAEAGLADYAVVPVENSTEGAVGRSLDLMTQTPLKVCGEVVLRIHQHLMRKQPDLVGITRIYSHSQSLAQCHEWLNLHLPHAERIAVASNAEAARLASADPGFAAIGGEAAAERYELIKVVSNIEDEPNNTTRFLVLGQSDATRSGKDKTSLVMSAKNQPGAVFQLLGPLAENGVSMTKFESRPSRDGLWEYVFFVDVEGHRDDASVQKAMKELADRAVILRVLGSYPVAVL
ncbi:prephenate dehydratase [Chitinivorax sp. B]|uniref:prephenate dehydratase n=1 Tax=Chitinivorax sp. B TaxID=2502235 RepID=UPI0010F877A5|nr:prephenate dehydratase [Chitinivorax sp. B]